MLLSDFVKAFRSENNISTPEIERRTNGAVRDATVSKIENNNVDAKNIRVKTIKALGEGLGVSPTYLFELAAEIEPSDSVVATETLRLLSELPENRQKDLLNMARAYLAEQKKQNRNSLNEGKSNEINKGVIPVKNGAKLDENATEEFPMKRVGGKASERQRKTK